MDATARTPFGGALVGALSRLDTEARLDLGCVASVGGFEVTYAPDSAAVVTASNARASLMNFLLQLISRLQAMNSAMPIDYAAYARSLEADRGSPARE